MQSHREDDSRIILHFDYDSFYATSVEIAQPSLRSLPLAIQQKHIIVTCNYEARRRGLRKLQLLTEARRICPDVVVVSGEDLDRFRDASKGNFMLIAGYVSQWGGKAERLGMDEVWVDATDLIEWNVDRLTQRSSQKESDRLSHEPSDPGSTWFALSRTQQDQGFWFDKRQFAGHVWPQGAFNTAAGPTTGDQSPLEALLDGDLRDPQTAQRTLVDARLLLGSHLAAHVRAALEEQRGYTAAAGVCINKTLAKLAGNVHKPRAQTTLVGPFFTGTEMETSLLSAAPPRAHEYDESGWEDDDAVETKLEQGEYFDQYYAAEQKPVVSLPPLRAVSCAGPPSFDTALAFVSQHDLSKIPGIGFKTASTLRAYFEDNPPPPAPIQNPLYTHQPGSHAPISAGSFRALPGMGARLLSAILSRPGAARDIGERVWALLHGIDVSAVAKARSFPVQISIEDSYLRLDKMGELRPQLDMLTARLIGRMRTDLKEDGLWVARPTTIRLSTKGRSPRDNKGHRVWVAKRFSRQAAMPGIVFGEDRVESIAEKVVGSVLMGLFRALHPEQGWDLSLVNVAATGIYEVGGREHDIRSMFSRNEAGGMAGKSNEWEDNDLPTHGTIEEGPFEEAAEVAPADPAPGLSVLPLRGSEDFLSSQASAEDEADSEWPSSQACSICGAVMPAYAHEAHLRFHTTYS